MSTKSKRRDPAVPAQWPVEQYPYAVHRKYVQHPKYCLSLKAAKAYLAALLVDFREDMKMFDVDVPHAVGVALQMVDQMPDSGGTVDVIVAPYTSTRFQAEIVKRKEV